MESDTVGEKSVLFLTSDTGSEKGFYYTTGQIQGKFKEDKADKNILRDSLNKEEWKASTIKMR